MLHSKVLQCVADPRVEVESRYTSTNENAKRELQNGFPSFSLKLSYCVRLMEYYLIAKRDSYRGAVYCLSIIVCSGGRKQDVYPSSSQFPIGGTPLK